MTQTIIFITTGLGRGGAETQLMGLAGFLKERDWEVHIVSMLDRCHFEDELEELDLAYHCLHMERGLPSPMALLRAIALLRDLSPQVVVTFMLHANTLGRIAARLAGIPVVVSSIRNEKFGGRMADLAERALAPLADVVTTNSRLAAEGLSKRGVAGGEDLVVIPNGVDLGIHDSERHESSTVRGDLGINGEAFFWLAVGHHRVQKDYRNLLRAMARLIEDSDRDIQLRVAGHGPLIDENKARCRSLGIEKHVQILGYRDDIPALMQAADGFVLSSAWEGLPNVVMEAMAARLPVVATDVGGVSELVEDGQSGLLVQPHQDAELAEAMASIMECSETHRRRMGERGRAFVMENFEATAVFGQWEELFERLMEEKLVAQ